MQAIKELQKFVSGQAARDKWAKTLHIETSMSMNEFNLLCDNVFEKAADIKLDEGKRQTVIEADPVNKKDWNDGREKVYTIVRNGIIVKIGGTRNGMKNRFGSYLCGHHVGERGKSGKMSVTNAHLYHTIEKDLLETDNAWEFYSWTLPEIKHTIIILGIETTVVSQTYHAYESCCIGKYKSLTGTIPILCDNCDPAYKS